MLLIHPWLQQIILPIHQNFYLCENKTNHGEKLTKSSTNSDQGKQTTGVKKPMDSGGLIFPPLWPSNHGLRYLSLQTYQLYIRNNHQPL